MSGHVSPRSLYYAIFGALMALTAITVGVAFINLGPFNFPVAISIAIIKATLVILFFMHVMYSSRLTKLIIATGFFFLGILFLSPETGRIARLIEAHGPAHESVTGRIARITAVSRFELAILFAVVLDMTLKPTADDAWFWALAAVIVLAGAVLALSGYRRPRGAAADLA